VTVVTEILNIAHGLNVISYRISNAECASVFS